MLYNDEETRKKEEQFQKDLALARSFTQEEKDRLQKALELLTKEMQSFLERKDLQPDELTLLAEIKKKMKLTLENMTFMKNTLDESLVRQANTYYYHIQKLAMEGDEKAIEIYKGLKPSYQASIKIDISEN